MPTAAEAIAAWLLTGNAAATLTICDMDAVALPPLPAGLRVLYCYNCTALTTLGELPVTLTRLICNHCPALVALPRLPAKLKYLECSNCSALIALPSLPAGVLVLYCYDNTALVASPRLPGTLTALHCHGCTALRMLPPLPAAVRSLDCTKCTSLVVLPNLDTLQYLGHEACSAPLPHACPPELQQLEFLHSEGGVQVEWRRRVAAQHAADRRHAAAHLPPLALLYV